MKNIIQLFTENILNENYTEEEIKQYSADRATASVAMIFKKSEHVEKYKLTEWAFDILYLRRQPNNRDGYSGQLCFPGGRKQENQSLLETAIRETYEQTGIRLQKDNLVCSVQRDFFAGRKIYKGKNVEVYTKLFIFYLNQQPIITLDRLQVCEYKWFPFHEFIDPRQSIFGFVQLKSLDYSLITSSLVKMDKFNQAQFKQNYISTFMPGIQIGMGNLLFGLTFYITIYLLNKVLFYYHKCPQFSQKHLHSLKQLFNHSLNIKTHFKHSYKHKKEASKLVIESYLKLRISSIMPKF